MNVTCPARDLVDPKGRLVHIAPAQCPHSAELGRIRAVVSEIRAELEGYLLAVLLHAIGQPIALIRTGLPDHPAWQAGTATPGRQGELVQGSCRRCSRRRSWDVPPR